MKKSRGLHKILREPNPVWGFSKSPFKKKRMFPLGLEGVTLCSAGRWGPVLGRGDRVLQKVLEGQGGWGVAHQEGRRDE